VDAGALEDVVKEVTKAKAAFGLAEDAEVVTCYEAGRDGFWLHRWLDARGIRNLVVDSSSIEVNRRARHTKTDRVDAEKLVSLLVEHETGPREKLRVVRVPSFQAEDARHLHRGLDRLKKERTALTNRIIGLLFSHGVRLSPVEDGFPKKLAEARLWDGSPLPPGLAQQVKEDFERRKFVEKQISERELRRKAALKAPASDSARKAQKIMQLRALGEDSAWKLAMEIFGWRTFSNRKQLGAFVGLTPVPNRSGDMVQDQAISKSGRGPVRALLIEMAWNWIRWQPNSHLTQWFHQRFGEGKRMRRIGIVAVARKLLIAIWRWVEFDEKPEGAIIKRLPRAA
jgi:transposase